MYEARFIPNGRFYFFSYSTALKALACGNEKDIDSFRRIILKRQKQTCVREEDVGQLKTIAQTAAFDSQA